jgi:hypothetical protein
VELSLADLNAKFDERLRIAGYSIGRWKLNAADFEGCVAENAYFALAFQPFETWDQLRLAAKPAELEVGSRMRGGSTKVWDTYLLLACQETLRTPQQLDQCVAIEYDTKRMRKLVAWGATNLSVVDELVRPFLALERIQEIAQTRDPLKALGDKLIALGDDPQLVGRALTLFKETRSLDGL